MIAHRLKWRLSLRISKQLFNRPLIVLSALYDPTNCPLKRSISSSDRVSPDLASSHGRRSTRSILRLSVISAQRRILFTRQRSFRSLRLSLDFSFPGTRRTLHLKRKTEAKRRCTDYRMARKTGIIENSRRPLQLIEGQRNIESTSLSQPVKKMR